MRLFQWAQRSRRRREEEEALLELPYAPEFEWNVERLHRVRDLERRGVGFVVRRPAFGNQAVVSLASFPTEPELADLVADQWGAGIYSVCDGARVIITYRLAGPETGPNTGWRSSTRPAASFRQRVDELLAERVEDVLDYSPELVRALVDAALRTQFHLPLPEPVDRWDELAMEVVKDNPAYQDQLVKAHLRKLGIEVDKPTADPLDEFIEQTIKMNEIRDLLSGERGGTSPIGVALLEATRAVVETLNSGQLLELVRTVQLLRTQARASDQASEPPHDESPTAREAPVADTAAAAPDPMSEVPPKEPAHTGTPETERPNEPKISDPTTEGNNLLKAASSVNWLELAQEVRDGPGSFIERARQAELEGPEMPLGRVFRMVRDNDTSTVVAVLRRAGASLVEDPFRATIIKEQGQAGFDAAMQIRNFLSTDAGIRWLAGARQMALGLGIDDGEGGHEGGREGVGGGSYRPTVEEGEP